jgi:hypothetical protein
MKRSALVLSLSLCFFSQSVFSKNITSVSLKFQSLNCVTEYPTTSFVAQTENNKINVVMVNHNGKEFLPIHSGIITIYDLLFLQSKAEALSEISTELSFSFSPEQCQLFSDETFSCYKSFSAGTSETSLIPISLHSLNITTQVGGNTYKEREISIGLSNGTYTYNVNMRYTLDECQINSLSPAKTKKPHR